MNFIGFLIEMYVKMLGIQVLDSKSPIGAGEMLAQPQYMSSQGSFQALPWKLLSIFSVLASVEDGSYYWNAVLGCCWKFLPVSHLLTRR